MGIAAWQEDLSDLHARAQANPASQTSSPSWTAADFSDERHRNPSCSFSNASLTAGDGRPDVYARRGVRPNS